MPLEFYFRYHTDEGIQDGDPQLLEPGQRSGLYADVSTGEKLLIGGRCDKDDICSVEIYASEGIIDSDEPIGVDEEDLPPPIGTVIVDETRDHDQIVVAQGLTAELIAKYKPLGQISIVGETIIIPNSLIYPQ